MSRSSRFFHSALDFLHALHGRVKHAVKPIVKSTKRRPKAVRRLSSESRNASVTDVPEETDNATPITRLVCQTCEAAKIAQSVTAGRRLDVTCKTALGTCVVGGLVTPPKLEREQSNRKWIPKVTKHKRKAKKEVAANPTPSNMKQEAVSVAINVQPPSPQKMSQPSGGGGCCGGGCGCGPSQNIAPPISTPSNKADTPAAPALATPGQKGALLAVASRTPRKPTLKALSTPVKTPRRSLATPSLRRRSATPRRRSPRNTELRRVAQVGRAGRTATMVGLGSLMGARAFAGGSVAFLGVNLSSTGTHGPTAQSANSPRLLIVADKSEGPSTPGRSPWSTRPATPYHNHIRNVRTRSVTKARLSVSPFAGRLGQDSARTPSHHQLLSSGLKPPKMRSPIVKTISPISFDSALTPVKTTASGVRSAFRVRFTETPQVSLRSTPLGTRGKPDLTMSLSSAIKAAGITAKLADVSDLEDVFEPPNVLTTITAARANYT